MSVLAIDPGYEQSAWVLFDGQRVVRHGIHANVAMMARFIVSRDPLFAETDGFGAPEAVVFEQIESFGMAVGREVFETVFWTGRMFQAACGMALRVDRMSRKRVKLHLCESTRAQDSNIRTALMDRFGGKEAAVGRVKSQGPLYGIKSHEWSALAIAVTWWDQCVSNERTLSHVQHA